LTLHHLSRTLATNQRPTGGERLEVIVELRGRHLGAVGRAAALALARVLSLATVVAALTPTIALAGVLTLASVLFFHLGVALLVGVLRVE
jgi:hypothetical protein